MIAIRLFLQKNCVSCLGVKLSFMGQYDLSIYSHLFQKVSSALP